MSKESTRGHIQGRIIQGWGKEELNHKNPAVKENRLQYMYIDWIFFVKITNELVRKDDGCYINPDLK